jgi:hypothetical protein
MGLKNEGFVGFDRIQFTQGEDRRMMSHCEHDNKPSDSKKGEELLH